MSRHRQYRVDRDQAREALRQGKRVFAREETERVCTHEIYQITKTGFGITYSGEIIEAVEFVIEEVA